MISAQIWILPITILVTATLLAFPTSRWLEWIMDGRYQSRGIFRRIETLLNSGGQNWKQYVFSILCFGTLLFVVGYILLSLQPWLPCNPSHKTLLSPSTIFHTVLSFITNTDLQHYAGEVHFSVGTQIFFSLLTLFLSPAIGLAALVAIIRALRGDALLGNFFVDIWRGVMYVLMPAACILAVIFIQQGSPMTLNSSRTVAQMETGKAQIIPLGPVAAAESIKMIGTNGAGFFSMNSAHPFENPTALTNFLSCVSMLLIPFALVLMYGRMLNCRRHSIVLFAIMMLLMAGNIAWTISFDTLQPNPAVTAQPARQYGDITIPAQPALPVSPLQGNMEGKEVRFGISAGATFAAMTTSTMTGAINAEMDSLNPLAALAPLTGIWLSCIFGGIGSGMVNMLIYIIIGLFIAGMMVGRTPEYLGRKIGAPELRLAILALLVHPLMILIPLSLFTITHWGADGITAQGAHGLTQMLYQFSSASANNGSAFNGLNIIQGFYNNPSPPPAAAAWDIATGLTMLFSRYMPVIAMIAMSALLGAKKPALAGQGTLRDDTMTFGLLLLGIIIVLGALLFLPVAVLGPVAESLGPMPFS